jgi:hypothetical protein
LEQRNLAILECKWVEDLKVQDLGFRITRVRDPEDQIKKIRFRRPD